jgi:hypothetical protein
MDTNSATLLAAVVGAVIGGPAGFFVERLVNRPRLKISYAETAYEDLYAFPSKITQNLLREPYFMDYVATQVTWSVKQRLTSGLFNKEELRQIYEFARHYMEVQNQGVDRIEKEFRPALDKGGDGVEALVPELETNYFQAYNASLSDDLQSKRDVTVKRLIDILNLSLKRTNLFRSWLNAFLQQTEDFIKRGRGTSDRMVVRISIGNSGYQSAIIQTEGRLRMGAATFRAPMQIASRPWESSQLRGTSQFYVVDSKAFLVLEFVLDENLNAKAELDHLRSNLQRGENTTFETFGIAGDSAASLTFRAVLD